MCAQDVCMHVHKEPRFADSSERTFEGVESVLTLKCPKMGAFVMNQSWGLTTTRVSHPCVWFLIDYLIVYSFSCFHNCQMIWLLYYFSVQK